VVTHNRNLSDRFHTKNCLKQGDALSPLLFNVALEYAISGVQINQGGFKVNGTHHELWVYAAGVNILGGHVRTVKKKNTEALFVASKEIGLELYTDKLKNKVMFGDKSAGRSHNMKINNLSFEVQMFRNNLNESELYSGRN